jgi:hypothetical protein
MKMNNNLTKLATAGVLSLCAAVSALAGSVTQPGETVGVAAGAPLPPGFYFVDTTDWGCRDTNPNGTCVGVTIPVMAWSTPWTILGARLQFLGAAPAVDVGVKNTFYTSGMYNPLLSGQLAWDLGYGWGFSYLLGAYIDVNSPVAWSSSSLNQRFALSYTGNGWNLTANAIWGIQFDQVTSNPQLSPCPVSLAFPSNGCNPNFINVDLTATKKFGKWELGWVGYYSDDLSAPVLGYLKQSQFAMGGLVGYNFGPLTLQAYLTTDVYEKNYGGIDTRGWARVIIPLGDPFAAPAPATGPMYRK